MMMNKEPRKQVGLRFSEFRILKITFDALAELKDSTHEVAPGIGLKHSYNKEEKSLSIFLRVWLPEGQQQYAFDIIAGGKFLLSDEPDEKMLENFARINCPAIMYPYVRETIADLTRRAGFSPLHLPPVNFVHLDLQPMVPKGKKRGIGAAKKSISKRMK